MAPDHPVVVILDATFFSRHDGVLVARAEKRNLFWKEIETEKTEYYEKVTEALLQAGIQFSAFVIDGRRGVLQRLTKKYPWIPVQFCQFHQIAIVTRYLSTRPKLDAGQELRKIALTLARTDRKSFTEKIEKWHLKWRLFLQEKTLMSP